MPPILILSSLDDSPEIERFYSLKNLPSILGGDFFKEMIKEKFGHLLFHKEIPAARKLATDAETIIASVCRYFGVSYEDLMVSRRGVENLPRDMAIYLVRQRTRETLSEVGGYFGIENYSTVSSAVERIKGQKNKDRRVEKIIEKIVNGLGESQKQIAPFANHEP